MSACAFLFASACADESVVAPSGFPSALGKNNGERASSSMQRSSRHSAPQTNRHTRRPTHTLHAHPAHHDQVSSTRQADAHSTPTEDSSRSRSVVVIDAARSHDLLIALSRYWLTSRVVFLPADLLPAGSDAAAAAAVRTQHARTSTRQLHRSAVARGGHAGHHASAALRARGVRERSQQLVPLIACWSMLVDHCRCPLLHSRSAMRHGKH